MKTTYRAILDTVAEKGYNLYATEQFTYNGITHIYDIDTLKDIVAFKYVGNTYFTNDIWLDDELIEERFFIEMEAELMEFITDEELEEWLSE